MSLSDIVRLLRPQQWYKNLLVFLPLIFVLQFFRPERWPPVLVALLALCAISSAGYIFNDIVDVKKDRRNPEKRDRPIAARTISIPLALGVMVVLFAFGTIVLLSFHVTAALAGASIFIVTMLYSLYLKAEPVIDVVAIGINFVLRAAVGGFVLAVEVSPWLIICTFFFALILAVGKRVSERSLDNNTGLVMMGSSASMFIMSYALYAVLHDRPRLLYTLPFIVYGVMRYVLLALEGKKSARQHHLLFFDARLVAAVVVCTVLTLLLL